MLGESTSLRGLERRGPLSSTDRVHRVQHHHSCDTSEKQPPPQTNKTDKTRKQKPAVTEAEYYFIIISFYYLFLQIQISTKKVTLGSVPGFCSTLWAWQSVGFACSPCVRMGTPVSSYSQKNNNNKKTF